MDVHQHKEMAVDAPTVAEGLTSGDWLGIIGLLAAVAGTLGMVIFNIVMKRLDRLDGKMELTSDRVIKIMTELKIEDVTRP